MTWLFVYPLTWPPCGSFPRVMSEWEGWFRSLVSTFITETYWWLPAVSLHCLIGSVFDPAVLPVWLIPPKKQQQIMKKTHYTDITQEVPCRNLTFSQLLVFWKFCEFTYMLTTPACSCCIKSQFLPCLGIATRIKTLTQEAESNQTMAIMTMTLQWTFLACFNISFSKLC